MAFFDLSSLLISLAALLVSVIALIYTVEAFLLKSGHKIRGSITIGGNVDCEDRYVVNLTLENIKDKASVIFSIYLKIGRNNYLELESFKEAPLILSAFEVYHKDFDPILFYLTNLKRIDIDRLLIDEKVKKTIVLSTTSGKYEVSAHIKHWSPTYEYFSNFYTAIIRPQRLKYNGRSYGINIKYLVNLTYDNDSKQVLAIHKDPGYNKLKDLHFTYDILSSQSSLETFFQQQKEDGNLSFKDIEVLNCTDAIENRIEHYTEENLKAEAYNFFQYRIIGKLKSVWMDFELLRENKKLRNRNRKIKEEGQ